MREGKVAGYWVLGSCYGEKREVTINNGSLDGLQSEMQLAQRRWHLVLTHYYHETTLCYEN